MKYTNNQKLWREFIEDTRDIDISSFIPKRSLAAPLWEYNERMNDEVRERLLKIANKFFEDLELNKKLGYEVEIADIILTGSVASYNWSQYSDVDLHILIDFKDVDSKFDFVSDYFRAKISNWNKIHEIYINSFEVEIYVQDKNEPHVSNGIYSVLKDLWLQKPTRQRENIDFDDVRKKSTKIMNIVDSIEQLYVEQKYEEAHDFSGRLKEKIRKFRKCGLEKGGIYSPENLSFKVLRRNGYLNKLSGLSTNSYDKMMSLKENFNKNWKAFLYEGSESKNTLYAFDFDNTLISNNGNIYLKNPRVALNQTEFDDFKKKNKELSDEDFDFSDILDVSDAKVNERIANLMLGALGSGDPGVEVVILSARADQKPIKDFIKDKLGLSNIKIVCVNSPEANLEGRLDAEKKSNWLENQILKGFKAIKFWDDSGANVQAAAELQEKYPGVNVESNLVVSEVNEEHEMLEIEKFQQAVRKKHRRMKKKLVGKNGRGKSAPPGFGGT